MSFPPLGPTVAALLGVLSLAAAGVSVLLGVMVVSSGVSFSFLTEGERNLLPGLGGATVEGLRLGGVLAAFFASLLMGITKAENLRRVWPYLLFLLLATTSLLWSPDKIFGARLLARLAYPLVAFVICSNVVRSQGDIPFRKLCCWSALLATCVNAFLAVKEISTGGLLQYGLRYHGSAGPMDFGLYCAAAGLTLYVMWTRYGQRKYLLLALLLVIQLIATGTRTSLIAGAAGLITVQILLRRPKEAIAVVLSGVIIWALVPTLGARTLQGGVSTEWISAPVVGQLNLSGRAVIWDDVRNGLIGDVSLIGHGLGATQKFMSSRYILPHDVHNAYLLILADVGVVGLAAYLAFLIGTATVLLKAIRRTRSCYSVLSLGLLTLLTLSGFVQNPLYVYGAAPMFLFVGLALSAGEIPPLVPFGPQNGA